MTYKFQLPELMSGSGDFGTKVDRIAGLDEDFLLCPDFFFRLIMGFHFFAVANGTHNFAKIHI